MPKIKIYITITIVITTICGVSTTTLLEHASAAIAVTETCHKQERLADTSARANVINFHSFFGKS